MARDPQMAPPKNAVYGVLPPELAGTFDVPADAIQCDPHQPGAEMLEEMAPESLDALLMHAPPGTLERRYTLAAGLAALKNGAPFTVLASNTKGGARLLEELRAFGCAPAARPKRRHQVLEMERPLQLTGIEAALEAGAPHFLDSLGLYSQPGVFSWDRLDPGSELLIEHLPALAGRGADLGCGIGILARAVIERALAEGRDVSLSLIDNDLRALRLAERNLKGAPVVTLWRDVRRAADLPSGLDFVVMNPPFHDAGTENRDLGRTFIQKAAAMLSARGTLWMTANRQLAYEKTLQSVFGSVEQIIQKNGYKIFRAAEPSKPARRPTREPRGGTDRQRRAR